MSDDHHNGGYDDENGIDTGSEVVTLIMTIMFLISIMTFL